MCHLLTLAFFPPSSTQVTVVLASLVNVPVSSTHCPVGAIIFLSLIADGPSALPWSLMGRIALSWVLTVPISGLVSAATLAAFQPAIRA